MADQPAQPTETKYHFVSLEPQDGNPTSQCGYYISGMEPVRGKIGLPPAEIPVGELCEYCHGHYMASLSHGAAYDDYVLLKSTKGQHVCTG